MSTYVLLQDHWIGTNFLPAGSTQSTADVGGLLPVGWVPTPNVDPIDAAAVTAFYKAGPQFPGLTQVKPATYWALGLADFSPADFGRDFYTASSSWGLTGLGSN